MKTIALVAALLLGTGFAQAQEDLVIDQSKVYVTEPDACEAIESQGAEAFVQMDFRSLSFSSGIQSLEFQCDFFDVNSRANTPLLFVDAVCSFPGELYPDIFAIAPNGADEILVVSGAETTLALASSNEPPSDFPVGTTIYHRCENLSEIPID
jgi:hypothetical protein